MKNFLLPVCLFLATMAYSQNDLLQSLDSTQVEDTHSTATFKALQLVTLQTTKSLLKKNFILWYRIALEV